MDSLYSIYNEQKHERPSKTLKGIVYKGKKEVKQPKNKCFWALVSLVFKEIYLKNKVFFVQYFVSVFKLTIFVNMLL